MGGVSSALQNPDLLKLVQSLGQVVNRPGAQQGGITPTKQGQLPIGGPQQPPGFQGAPIPQAPGAPATPQAPIPQAPQAPQVSYNTGGTQGQMPMPQQAPPRQNFQSPPGSEIAQSKLGSPGAAASSAIQGVAQTLNQWNQRTEAKRSAEAANIAQNLMTAIQNGDAGMVSEILNDPHSTKVLNKVYKGWLVKDQEAQKQKQTKQKPPDPQIQGFEQGMSQFIQKQQQGQTKGQQPSAPPTEPPKPGQPPPQPGQPPPGQPPQGQGQMPQSVGGYRIPQAGPAQLDARAKEQANIQANQADPGRMVTPSPWDQTPANQAALERAKATVIKANTDTKRSELELQKADAEYKKALLGIRTEEQRQAFQKSELNTRYQKSLVDVDIQKQKLGIEMQRYRNLQQTGANIVARGDAAKAKAALGMKISQGFQVKLRMLQQAQTALLQLKTGGGKIDKTNVTGIVQALKASGAVGVAKKLQDEVGGAGNISGYFKSYSTPDELLDDIKLYKQGMQATYNLDDNWMPLGEGSTPPKTGSGEADPDDSEEVDEEGTEAPPQEGDIIDTPKGKMKFKGGDPTTESNYEPYKDTK